MPDHLIVTGGLGFIGSAFVRRALRAGKAVTNLDVLTYAADRRRVPSDQTRFDTHAIDIRDPRLEAILARTDARVLVHFAAETHVTRSETDEERFFATNVDGTRNVLEAARAANMQLVIHVSTDEVYGPALDHPFREEEKDPGEGRATSAYARSKAAADDLAQRFGRSTHVIVVRPTNCYGPWQHPEKAIPRWATRALTQQRLPVWGDGGYVRDWMHVDDACSAIELLIDRAPPSDVYNIGPEGDPVSNLEIARLIAEAAGASPEDVYLTEYDRPDHDRRYAVDSSKLRALGWSPRVDMRSGLRETVAWYSDHRSWWEPVVAAAEELYDDDVERVR